MRDTEPRRNDTLKDHEDAPVAMFIYLHKKTDVPVAIHHWEWTEKPKAKSNKKNNQGN